ncbi:Gfo/Idh/MocA family protein [Novipirellula artificiosorum]|uniref:Putative 4,5-dihydroxyphthalate dehydrogenase n=1 Tax=Novipirellula artificiosorum TaxID=2528016 RepID=A0A5C6D1G1_9BACT|nr:Gfo/Idh/MocA family oxidoreductase [Novipirellula artificiosorum]TWU31013.1 putative 4,5-dihydroxyphthalate dehydrogenase [Novipirellula artificiosorum]
MARHQNNSRRDFLRTAGAAVSIPYVITSSALGAGDVPPASDRIVMGGIGIGNMGRGDQGAFLGRSDVQYVAVCDCRSDVRDAAKAKVDERYQNADCTAYGDFRELLARADVDAVHVATPDHWHAIMVVEACRNGKDVYCQKPETRTLAEGPAMVAAARRYSRVVSGGSQRVLEDYRDTVEPCWNGEKGTIRSINVNVGPLSQPCNLPAESVPETMDWEMWLGPAPWAPYNKARCDGNFSTGGGSWRSYIDYSGGGMTDWGAHHFGGATFAIDVREDQPEEVIYHDESDRKYLSFRYPSGVMLHHNKPNTGNLQVEGTPGEKIAGKPLPSYKGHGGIYGDFIECVKTREKPFRDIELAVNTVALSHLGIIAYQLRRSLRWNAVEQQFVDDAEANRFLDRARREPWQL